MTAAPPRDVSLPLLLTLEFWSCAECVCVCVCVRERERDLESQFFLYLNNGGILGTDLLTN